MSYLQKARRVTDKYILLLLGLFPLFWGNDGYNNITRSKFLFFACVTGLWFLLCLGLLGLGLAKRERFGLRLRPVHWALLAYLGVCALSAAASPFGGRCLLGTGRYDGYLTQLLLCVMFLGVSLLASPRRLYAWALGFSVFLCCAVSLVQVTGVNFLGLYPDGTSFFDNYIVFNGAFLGTLGNAGITSAFLCFAAPVLMVTALRSRQRADRWLLLPAALAVAVIALCQVDAGYAALLGCALVCLCVLPDKKKTRRAMLAAVAAAVVCGLCVLWFWPGQSGVLWEASRVLHGDLRDEFGSHRIQIWRNALALVPERPLLGGGPGTACARLDIEWSRYIPELGKTRTTRVDNTHNVYLGVLINTGVLGLGAYLAALGLSFASWLRRSRKSVLYAALGAGVLSYLIQDFFGIGLVLSSPFLWLGWALLETPRIPRPTASQTLPQPPD